MAIAVALLTGTAVFAAAQPSADAAARADVPSIEDVPPADCSGAAAFEYDCQHQVTVSVKPASPTVATGTIVYVKAHVSYGISHSDRPVAGALMGASFTTPDSETEPLSCGKSTCKTDAKGDITYSMESTVATTWDISIWSDLNGNGEDDDDNSYGGTATVQWVGGAPSCSSVPSPGSDLVVLEPEPSETPAVNTSVTLTALVQSGSAVPFKPVPKQKVTFKVSCGPNAGRSASSKTDAGGQASFTYKGSKGVGTDTVTVSYKNKAGATRQAAVNIAWVKAPPSFGACDPGSDTKWYHVAGKTFTCIVSGEVWSDPDLYTAPLRECITGLVQFVPFGKALKLAKNVPAAKALSTSIADVVKKLKKSKLSKDAATVDDIETLVKAIRTPDEAFLTIVSSHRVLDALIAKLNKGSADAKAIAADLLTLKDGVTDLIRTVSGIDTIDACVEAVKAA